MHVWTQAEIERLPHFGNGHGWFYGLARSERGRLTLAEIYPGLGAAAGCWPTSPRGWWWALRDLLRYRP